MANTYSQIHLQGVFAVQNPENLIRPEWRDPLFKYITCIIQNDENR